MTYCKSLYSSIDSKLIAKMSINDIVSSLCPDLARPRHKIISIIKSKHGQKFLNDNSDWLGYQPQHKRIKKMIPFTGESPYLESFKKFVDENFPGLDVGITIYKNNNVKPHSFYLNHKARN